MADQIDDGESARVRRKAPSMGAALALFVGAWAAIVASKPLDDNSFLTHLATGRLILDRGSVPDTDPYTFTALGEPWTVQSWLISVVLAAAEQAAGALGLRVVALVAFVGVTLLLWRLTRSAESIIPRLGLIVLVLFVVSPNWVLRPYAVGMAGLALVILALDRQLPPVVLVPVFWIWANSHGSYPLGFALMVLVLIGQRLDGAPVDRALRVLGWSVLGTLTAVIGPLTFRVLTFPLTSLERSEVFAEVAEWQAPDFQSTPDRLFLVLVLLALVAIHRLRRWSVTLPVGAFVVMALVAQRNIAMAVIVLTPAVAAAVGSLGSLRSTERSPITAVLAVAGGLVFVLSAALTLLTPADPLDRYPAHALAWLEPRADLGELRLATEVSTGNLLEALDGPTGEVFIDDRFDMFPREVFDDALSLVRGHMDWQQVLDRYDIDAVLIDRSDPTGSLLAASPAWRVVYSDDDWLISCRRDGGCQGLS